MKKWIVAGAIAALAAVGTFAGTATWQIDPMHSSAQFSVRHFGISNVKGEFEKIGGTVMLDDQDISKSSVSATIDASTINTRVQKRDDDLKSDKFFDVAKFPTLTFQSTKIWKTGDGTAKMTGNLTMHGVTKEVTFDVSGPTAPVNAMGVRRGASATTTISRKDFGLTADAGLVGDDVTITLDIEMTQQK
jgi:polyisoprenoid-binding protein YceI